MKKAILITMFMLGVLSPAFAGVDEGPVNVTGVKIDAPDLVKINADWSIGAEVSKEFYQYLDDKFEAEDGDRGYTGYVKVTYRGTLLNLSKGKQ